MIKATKLIKVYFNASQICLGNWGQLKVKTEFCGEA
jgi:hypothetical protein